MIRNPKDEKIHSRRISKFNRQMKNMGRIIQPKGTKGSLKWIQHVINKCPHLLDDSINQFINGKKEADEWLSPMEDDEYAEYRDQAFLDLLGIKLGKKGLKAFWPSRGPQWDALGRIGDRAYFMVEAKAHVSELLSSSQAKSPTSKSLIEKSLNATRSHFKLKPDIDLSKGFYQYVNRLAHLYFLRVLKGIPAYLVFVYFLNDPSHIPTSQAEFTGALHLMHLFLGANNHAVSKFIMDIFIDVGKMKNKLPKDLMVFDPDHPPFQKEYTCVLLSDLRAEEDER